MTDQTFDGIGQEPAFPEGMGQLMRNILANPERQDGGPFVHSFQPPAATDDVPLLPWMDPEFDLTGMTWEQAQRRASIGFCRMVMHADWQMFMGANCEPPTWAEAEAFYEKVQAEKRAEEAALAAAAEQPAPVTIRMVGDRRMQCKDIPDETFLDAVRATPSGYSGDWRNRHKVQATLEQAIGPVPENLFLAKARRLGERGLLGGCTRCSCLGDYHLSEDCRSGCCGEQPPKPPLFVSMRRPQYTGVLSYLEQQHG